MAKFTQTYPTDLQYTEWQQLEQYFPASKRGRPRKWEMWLIVNAIFYVTRTGCQWRMLPSNFPPWQTSYGYYRRWTRAGLWAKLNAALVRLARTRQGRDPAPSAAVLDSQSVKTSEGGEARGVDVYKQTNGRKRHIVVDTLGLLLLVVVHSASVQDAAGGQLVLQGLFDRIKKNVHNRWCRLKLIWVDGAYAALIAPARQRFGWRLEVVSRLAGTKGFQVLPHRWVVEIVFPQMTKPGEFTAGGSGNDITDLDLIVRDNHSVDEQFHQLPFLLEGRVGQASSHTLAERLHRGGQPRQFGLAIDLAIQLLRLCFQRPGFLLQRLPPALILS